MKRSLKDLAIMGGEAEFAEPVIVGRPNLGDEETFVARIGEIFARRRLSNNGPLVHEFERRIAEMVGVRNCVATANATLGLELSIAELGMTGSVVIPSLTFIATAHALARNGVTPLFCDVDAETHVIDPESVEQMIRPDTTGILAVHLWGNACPVAELEALAKKRGLRLLFDAAHAFGSTYQGQPIGGFGDAEVFSFHATKAINAFEGGAVVTDDDLLAARLREAINFGLDKNNRVTRVGTNAKMNEACAAMGLTSLEAMDLIFAHNARNDAAYREGLQDIPGIRFLGHPTGEVSNAQFLVIEVDPELFGWDSGELLRLLAAENILARRYFSPGCHRSEPYSSIPETSRVPLEVTDRLCSRILCLPTGTSVTPEQVGRICAIMALAACPAPELKTRLAC